MHMPSRMIEAGASRVFDCVTRLPMPQCVLKLVQLLFPLSFCVLSDLCVDALSRVLNCKELVLLLILVKNAKQYMNPHF